MNNDAVLETRRLLEDTIQQCLTDDAIKNASKKLKDVAADLESDFQYNLQADVAYNLAGWVYRMFEQSVEAMFKGDEAEMRRRLSCQGGSWTGRDRDHPVIHGKLFEIGAIALRKQVVEAHAELLKSERILDLEDQVKSLVAQVNKLEREKSEMWERVRNYVP